MLSGGERYLAPGVADEASLEREVDRLYGLPLDEFTSARNELARELKRSGDAAAAERVRKLEKPTRSAGAINRAVRRKRRDAKRLLDAAAKLGEAQEKLIEGGERRPVDQAVDRERAAVDRLMADVEAELGREGEPTEAMLDRARATLHAVATNPELRNELEAGRFTEDHEAVGLGGLVARRPAHARPASSEPLSAETPDARSNARSATWRPRSESWSAPSARRRRRSSDWRPRARRFPKPRARSRRRRARATRPARR